MEMTTWKHRCECDEQVPQVQKETWNRYEEVDGKMFYYTKGKKRAIYAHRCNRPVLIQIRKLMSLSKSSAIVYAMKDACYEVYGQQVYEDAQLSALYWDEENGTVEERSNCRRHIAIDVIGKEQLHFEVLEKDWPKKPYVNYAA